MFPNDPTLYGVSIPRESSFVSPYYAQWQNQFPWAMYGQQLPFYGYGQQLYGQQFPFYGQAPMPMYGQQFQFPYFAQQGKLAPSQWEQPTYGRIYGQVPYTPYFNVPQYKWQHHFTY